MATDTRPWWRRPWVVPLTVLVVGFLVYALPPYLTLDPAQSRSQLNAAFPPHYPMLELHIAFGTVAIVTVCLQLWPWLRQRHPAVHRTSGRLYVFAGMGPSAVLALAITPVTSLTLIGKVGAVAWAVLGLITTITGFLMARRRRFSDHRRWMLYSFAFAMTPITGRALFYPVLLVPGLDFQDLVLIGQIGAFWLGWIINVALVALWLRRTPRRQPQRPSRAPRQAAA